MENNDVYIVPKEVYNEENSQVKKNVSDKASSSSNAFAKKMNYQRRRRAQFTIYGDGIYTSDAYDVEYDSGRITYERLFEPELKQMESNDSIVFKKYIIDLSDYQKTELEKFFEKIGWERIERNDLAYSAIYEIELMLFKTIFANQGSCEHEYVEFYNRVSNKTKKICTKCGKAIEC